MTLILLKVIVTSAFVSIAQAASNTVDYPAIWMRPGECSALFLDGASGETDIRIHTLPLEARIDMGVISYPIDGFHLGRTCQEALFATARHGALIEGSEPLRPGRYVWILNEGPVLGEAHITMVRQQYSAGDGVISTLNRSGQKVWQLLSQISQRSVFSVKPDLVETEDYRYESRTGATTREKQPFNSLNRSRRHLTSLVPASWSNRLSAKAYKWVRIAIIIAIVLAVLTALSILFCIVSCICLPCCCVAKIF